MKVSTRTGACGRQIIEFQDRYGKPCTIAESLDEIDVMWLVYSPSQYGMYLTQEQVRELLPILQRFAESGRVEL